MTNNPIIYHVTDPHFIKREKWLRNRLQEALDQPFISFYDLIKINNMGLYMIYESDELLYIGMTTRIGSLRLGEIIKGFRNHTLNRKLLAQYFRGLGHQMHVINPKTYKRIWIDSGIIPSADFKTGQIIINEKIKSTLRFRFYETQMINLESFEHYAIALLNPSYND